MYFIGKDADGRITAWLEADENPDANLWEPSPWQVPPDDFDDWKIVDGELVRDPRNLPLPDLDPAAVIKAIFTASPALTTGIVDALAARMKPYLPDYDSTATYTIGTLVVMDGVVKRKTISGWREVR